MAVLPGFPPSNTISPGTKMSPEIVEKNVEVGKLRSEDLFRCIVGGTYQKFMFISKQLKENKYIVRAICLDNGVANSVQNFEVLSFDLNTEVVWIQQSYGEGNEIDSCRGCGQKLVSDKLSEKYGDYCPNLWCTELN